MDFVQIISNPVFQAAILAAASYGSWKNRQRIAKILHESPEPQVRDFVAEIRAATEQEAHNAKQTPKAPATLVAAAAATPAAPGPAVGTPAKPFVFVEAQTNVQTVKLSTVAKADNLLVVGQKGAGKTTLLQKVLATRLSDEMVALDPHSKPGKWPCPTIGAGRDYPTIGRALVSIEARMDERFKQLASGEIAEGVFPRRSVVTDEYRSIAVQRSLDL